MANSARSKAIRNWALVVLLVGDSLAIAITAQQGFFSSLTGLARAGAQTWCYFFIANTALVLIAELIRYLIAKKTISQSYGDWGLASRVLALTCLFLFWVNMTALTVHLAFYFL